MPYPDMLARGVTTSSFVPFDLWAGEQDLVTSQGTAAAPIRQFAVIARDANAMIVEWDGATGAPIGFAAQAAVANGPVPYFVGGVPNHEVLIWPAAINTLDKRKAAFDGHSMTIGSMV